MSIHKSNPLRNKTGYTFAVAPGFPSDSGLPPYAISPFPDQNILANSNPFKIADDQPQTYTSDDIASVFFQNIPKIDPDGNGKIFIYEEAKKSLLVEKKVTALPDSNLPEFQIVDNFPVDRIQIFISDNGSKLNHIADNARSGLNGKPKSNEILFFIESDTDLLSGKVMRTVYGASAKKKIEEENLSKLLGDRIIIKEDELEQILASTADSNMFLGHLFNYIGSYFQFGYKYASYGVEGLIELLDKCIIGERYWNPDEGNSLPDLVFNPKSITQNLSSFNDSLNEYVNKFSKLSAITGPLNKIKQIIEKYYSVIDFIAEQISDSYQRNISLIIGVWNGLIDMISGLLFILNLILRGAGFVSSKVTSVAKNITSANKRQNSLEYVDNILDVLADINFKAIFEYLTFELSAIFTSENIQKVIDNIKKNVASIKDKAIAKGSKTIQNFSLNVNELFYYIGFGITLFIPVAWIASVLGKAGKIGKVLGTTLEWLDNLVVDLFQIPMNALKRGGNSLKKILNKIFEKIRNGENALIDIISKFMDRLKKWLKDKFGIQTQKQPLLPPYLRAYRIKFIKELGVQNYTEFKNHLRGIVHIKKIKVGKDGLTEVILGKNVGGHIFNDNILIKNGTTPNPPIDDLPFFGHNVEIKSPSPKKSGGLDYREKSASKELKEMGFPKSVSIFPQNWHEDKILSEIAFVYHHNPVKNGKVRGFTSNDLFEIEIRIENGMPKTAYPINFL